LKSVTVDKGAFSLRTLTCVNACSEKTT